MEQAGRIPQITAYNRIDGPGSSLDLREFQEALWRLPSGHAPSDEVEGSTWTRGLPRTIGITISVGCEVRALPLDGERIGIRSTDYHGLSHVMMPGQVPYRKELWLMKVVDLFGLSGVLFDIHNLVAGIESSGLGGSATATTAVCLLANRLAGAPFNGEQVVSIASLLEQDMGVSITGTQEQSNVVFGGVTEYVWFPWGVPGSRGGYGSSIRTELLTEPDYPELASRIRVYHTGTKRASTDVNSVWRDRLRDEDGFNLHSTKLGIAYEYRAGIHDKDWVRVRDSIRDYADVRTRLCPDYMTAECWEIQVQCRGTVPRAFRWVQAEAVLC